MEGALGQCRISRRTALRSLPNRILFTLTLQEMVVASTLAATMASLRQNADGHKELKCYRYV